MSYSYYRQGPSWGSNQFRFGAPPAPSFQPQPSWQGYDFYREHARASGSSPDPSLFDSAWNRVRDHNREHSAGVGIHEARHWHSRAYGGMGELNQMLPAEIGHAAAYEAYRKWIHHSSMYEPLSADSDRQREALIGLAVAETTLLLQYTSRGNDPYTRRSAADSAASTASQIFFWSREHDDSELYQGRGRSYGSYDGGSSYGDSYTYDADTMHSRRRPRSRSRLGSRSPAYRHPLLDYSDERRMSVPIVPNSSSSYGSAYDNSYGSYNGMPMNGSVSMMGGNVPSVFPMRGRSMSIMGPTPYANGTQYSGVSYPYAGAQPQTQYVHAGGVGLPSGQGQMVVYAKSKKHHHRSSRHGHGHGHGHKKRSRSVSVEPMYIRY